MRVLLDTTYFLPSIGASLSQVPWDVVFRVREGNLDRALLASAVQCCDLFLTEDTELLRKGTELDEVLGEINTEFTIKNWADAKRSV
jgi:hypothetical protein